MAWEGDVANFGPHDNTAIESSTHLTDVPDEADGLSRNDEKRHEQDPTLDQTWCALAACNAVFCIIGTMGAWSFHCFLANPSFAQHFYKFTLNDEHAVPSHPALWSNVLNFITLTRLSSNFVSQSINLTPGARRVGIFTRIGAGITTLIFVVLTPLFLMLGHASETTGFALLLVAVAASGVATAFEQSTLFALAALFPLANFSISTLLGMSVAAMGSSVFSIITKAAFGPTFQDQRHQSFMYFALGACWGFFALVLLIAFSRTHVGQHGRRRHRAANIQDSSSVYYFSESRQHSMLFQSQRNSGEAPKHTSTMVTTTDYLAVPDHDNAPRAESSLGEPQGMLTGRIDEMGVVSRWFLTRSATARVVACTWPWVVVNSVIYVAEFALYPGVLVSVDNDDSWFKVNVTLLFNVAMTVGRLVAQAAVRLFPKLLHDPSLTFAAVMLRMAIVPLYAGLLSKHPNQKLTAYLVTALFEFVGGVASGIVAKAMPLAVDLRVHADDKAARSVSGTVFSLTLLVACIVGTVINIGMCHSFA